MNPHEISPSNAPKIWEWLNIRGGLAIWGCCDLSRPGQTWTTPVNDANGNPVGKPTWAASQIIQTITDPAEVIVIKEKIVKRFHVAVRMGGNGFSLKVTDGARRNIDKYVTKYQNEYGEAWHDFDYYSYENCLILVPDGKSPLAEWMAMQGQGVTNENASGLFKAE